MNESDDLDGRGDEAEEAGEEVDIETAGRCGDDSFSYTPFERARCLSVTSPGFRGKAPLFLKPAIMFTGVKDKGQALLSIEAIASVVIILPGLVAMYF